MSDFETRRAPVLVPSWGKDRHVRYAVYLVNAAELAAFLPAQAEFPAGELADASSYVDFLTGEDEL